ncbi:MAG: hypothetical protein CVU38_09080, partial [Chloroflexi bacterium HGW-Chloroflexi-1]
MSQTHDDQSIQARIAALEQELAELRQRQAATQGGARVEGDVDTQGGDFIGRDQHITYTGEEPPDDLLAAYYRCLAAECRRLPLGMIDKEFLRTSQGATADRHDVPLPDVYVDLDVVTPAEERARDGRAWAMRLMRGEGEDRTPLLEALSKDEMTKVVLLGDAGSGKTTFANYLTYLLAEGSEALPAPLTAPQRRLLPVRLVLREVAARHIPADAERGEAEMLWNALRDDIARHLGKPAAEKLFPYLQRRLMNDGGLILLDGLDEVPEARQRRRVLLEAVARLAHALGAARFVVTARPYAYADPDWRLPGFATLALAPFSEAQVGRFIERWYQAVRPALGWNAETARAKGERLRSALNERPYLGDLASRPLLLTLMATLHSSWGQLPEDRADLYEETTKLLLGRWQRAREVRGPDGEPVVEPGITEALGAGEDRLRAALETLALAVHERQRGSPEQDEGPADISEGDLLVAFKPLLGALAPDTLLAYLRDRAGLIVARDEGVYAFPHRSFQEYLAACCLANQPDFAEQLQKRVYADPIWWREACLLGVGKARQGGLGAAVHVVGTLLPAEPGDVAEPCAAHWQAAALTGQALVELRLWEKSEGQPHFEALLRRTRRWLVRLLEEGQLSPRERADAGDVLGRLGDPRPGVGTLIAGEREQPDILWVEAPAGEFTMGTPEGDKMAYDDEHPAHTLSLPDFYISRYPITNAQFGPFLADGGYDTEAYWTPEGWAWRHGAEPDPSPYQDIDQATQKSIAEWLAGRPAERRHRPFWWGDPKWGAATRPVVGVSWYEALAYCRWLAARWRTANLPIRVWRAGQIESAAFNAADLSFRLPSEAEWEKAARGPTGRRWPWENDWEDDQANTEEAKLNETSPVGCFPGGASPCGALEMAGNVWEWTRSRWGRTQFYRPDYGYPYDSVDGREDLNGPDP